MQGKAASSCNTVHIRLLPAQSDMMRGAAEIFSHTHLVIISSDSIVRAVDGILDCIYVVQNLPRSIDIRFAPFEITK